MDTMVKFYLGTMGFSYADWLGGFYPLGTPASNYLQFYQKYFNAVEIDSTFYGTPRRQTVLGWKHRAAGNFRFSIKTPQIITHQRGLIGVEAEMLEFLRAVELLEAHLGVVLIQMPPSFDNTNLNALADFVTWLPRDFRYAVELRHPSWYPKGNPDEPSISEIFQRLNIAWAITEYPGLPDLVTVTANHLYIRWIGQHGSYVNHKRERIDLSTRLLKWWQMLQPALETAECLFGFFNNDYAGHAPATCHRFKVIAGLESDLPKSPHQETLW